jgi:hypothetical protein
MKNHLLGTIPVITGGLLAATLASPVAARTVELVLPPSGDLTTITNPYFPLQTGMSYAYRAETEDGCEYNKVTVTTDTKMVTINGNMYTTRIVRDQEWEEEPEDGEECDYMGDDVVLIEDTQDYFGQDPDTQNVLYFGEETYSVDDESDECSTEGSWEAGVAGAQPGIIMLGDPRPGDRYMQEFLADVAEDWGAVQRLNARVSIDFAEDDYTGCLMTREWSPLEPGAIEHKFYCPLDGNPGPAGLLFIEELHGKNLYVEYIGPDFGVMLPGEGDTFPSEALDCDLPED